MKHSYGHETDEGCKYFSNGNNNVNVCIYNTGHIKTCDYLNIQFKFEQNVFMFLQCATLQNKCSPRWVT